MINYFITLFWYTVLIAFEISFRIELAAICARRTFLFSEFYFFYSSCFYILGRRNENLHFLVSCFGWKIRVESRKGRENNIDYSWTFGKKISRKLIWMFNSPSVLQRKLQLNVCLCLLKKYIRVSANSSKLKHILYGISFNYQIFYYVLRSFLLYVPIEFSR